MFASDISDLSWRLEQSTSQSPDIRAYKKFATDPKYQDRSIVGVDGSKIITAELSDRVSSESSALDDQMPFVHFHSEGRHNVYRSQDTREIVAHFKKALAQKYGEAKANQIFSPEDQQEAITRGLRQYQVKRVFEEAEKLMPSELQELIQKCSDEVETEIESLQNRKQELANSSQGYISLKIANLLLRLQELVSRLPKESQDAALPVPKSSLVRDTLTYVMDAAHLFASVAEKIADGILVPHDNTKGALKNISDLENHLHAAERALALIESEPFNTLVLSVLSEETKKSLLGDMRVVRQRLQGVRVEMQGHPILARRAELLRQKPVPTKPISSLSNASAGGGFRGAAVISSQAPITEEK